MTYRNYYPHNYFSLKAIATGGLVMLNFSQYKWTQSK